MLFYVFCFVIVFIFSFVILLIEPWWYFLFIQYYKTKL